MPHEPLHRTNIYLFASDVEYLHRTIGFGWTEKVRELVHDWVHAERQADQITNYLHPTPAKESLDD